MLNISKILTPVDYSPCSRAALDHALFFAARFSAKIDVLHVWDVPPSVRADMMVVSDDGPQSMQNVLLHGATKRDESVSRRSVGGGSLHASPSASSTATRCRRSSRLRPATVTIWS